MMMRKQTRYSRARRPTEGQYIQLVESFSNLCQSLKLKDMSRTSKDSNTPWQAFLKLPQR